MKIIPLADKIVVQRFTAEEASAGGILIPEAAKEKHMHCRVIAVGPGKLDGISCSPRPLVVKEGDVVLVPSSFGAPIKLDGKDYIIISEANVLAIVKE